MISTYILKILLPKYATFKAKEIYYPRNLSDKLSGKPSTTGFRILLIFVKKKRTHQKAAKITVATTF